MRALFIRNLVLQARSAANIWKNDITRPGWFTMALYHLTMVVIVLCSSCSCKSFIGTMSLKFRNTCLLSYMQLQILGLLHGLKMGQL